jgi:2-polyprenyl-3-methyl-5-hydroxy-6-metoxy-1,4-benzoquinol methylase
LIIEPTWSKRNLMLNRFDFSNKSVIDFGCGNKSILNYIKFKEYIGLDKVDTADIIIDFETTDIILNKTYDAALVLGVLEYIETPEIFLKKIKPYADSFYFMLLVNRKKKTWHGWKNAFTYESAKNILESEFKIKNLYEEHGYVLAECVK